MNLEDECGRVCLGCLCGPIPGELLGVVKDDVKVLKRAPRRKG